MKNKQIRNSLRRSISASTPDVLDDILLRCEQQKGAPQAMNTHTFNEPQNINILQKKPTSTGKRIWSRTAAVLAAVIVLAILFPLGYNNFSVFSVIGIDVNPSIEIKTNRFEKVLSVNPLNEEATIVLDNMNLKNVDIDVATR